MNAQNSTVAVACGKVEGLAGTLLSVDAGKNTLLSSKPFIIRPCLTSADNKPHTFRPIRVIDRSQLPLSFLDSSVDRTSPTTRLFSASANQFQGTVLSEPGSVLLAHLDRDKRLYAAELVQPGIYALCRLAAWVELDNFDQSSVNWCIPTVQQAVIAPDTKDITQPWWSHASVKRPREEDGSETHVKRLRLSMLPPSQKTPPQLSKTQRPNQQLADEPQTASLDHDAGVHTLVQPTTEEALEALAKQYLEAIYVSKTSLAFFAKGPLSRARAVFTSSVNGAGSILDLVGFLRSMIFKIDLMDTKYREKLPEVVRNFDPAGLSDDEQQPPSQKKRKRAKRPKLDKEGVYSFEQDFVKRWWRAAQSGPLHSGPGAAESLLKRKTADLRTRETFAQIVLILEIIALESSSGFQAASALSQQADADAEVGEEHTKKKAKRRAKKPQDLNLLLDLLTDKLSIWQSVEEDVFAALDTNPSSTSAGRPVDNDALRNFSAEVVTPFYKTRVPKEATALARKLGGHGAVSPEKQPKVKPKNAERKSADRKAPSKVAPTPRRPLVKAATGTQFSSRRPSLARSVTDSIIPGLKREGSEAPLASIPYKDIRPRASREPSIQLTHLKRRQVNMSSISSSSEAKLASKRRAQEELQQAISTLKKPNRGQAVKEFVEASEQRALGTSARKSKGMMRKPLLAMSNIQIAATPKNIRKINHFPQPISDDHQSQPAETEEQVPSSTVKYPQQRHAQSQPVRVLDFASLSSQVAETPRRNHLQRATSPDILMSSPNRVASTASKPGHVLATPSKRALKLTNFFRTPSKMGSGGHEHIAATPIKMAAVNSSPPELQREQTADRAKDIVPVREPGSIYDALGWNNDFDEFAP